MAAEIYDIGSLPPLGEIPEKMYAWTIRREHFGEPSSAFQLEKIDVPEIGDDEVLVYVMAAGVNYNNVWAALGTPVDVISARQKAGETEDFHIGGSDASGIVYKVGRKVRNVHVGDEVVIHCGTWDSQCPTVLRGDDPMYSPTFRIWGYETNYGSFAQFTRVKSFQVLPKPEHLSWEEASAYMLVGATAYRMLVGWGEKSLRKDDVALIWGGAGGLGSMAIQIARARGAIPVAVVSNDDKFDYCRSLGAKGCINRKDFDHWGMLPHWKDTVGYANWLKGVRKFGKALWDVLGEKRNPRLVFEHPGESTIPTSIFVCETGGSVVICAGTTGYNATVDLRYLWMRQKTLQGSHFANAEQAQGFNQLVIEGLVDPCLSRAFTFEDLPTAHQLMHENRHPHGNMAVLVGASEFGLGRLKEKPQVAFPVAPARDEYGAWVGANAQTAPAFTTESLDAAPAFVEDNARVADYVNDGLITCTLDTPVEKMARLMLQHRIHALVVMDASNKPVGVVSQFDLVLARQGRSPEDTKKLTAGLVMNPGCVTCDLQTPLSEAITTMTRQRIHRLVVVDRSQPNEPPVGVLAMTDIIRKTLDMPG